MNYGFIIANNGGKSKEYEIYYMQKREELFDYRQDAYPEAVTPLKPDSKHSQIKRIHLRNAHLGLLRSYEQAETLLEELRKKFDSLPLEIVIIEYENATKIQWYTKTGIEDNSAD